MYTKKIYFSCDKIHELRKFFKDMIGIVNVVVGVIDAKNVWSYDDPEPAIIENISGLEIEFNPKKIDLSKLLDTFFSLHNPYRNKTLGIFYTSGEDAPQIELHMNFIANRDKEPVVSNTCVTINAPNINHKFSRKCFVRIGRLTNFVALPSEE